MRPLISIITPTYNHQNFISQCIESVLSQTLPDWEMIIIDDASTDKTAEIIKKYKDRRIKFIKHNENWGPLRLGETYNEALNMAQGEYISILEGDDLWAKEALEELVSAFEKDIVLTYGQCYMIDHRQHIVRRLCLIKDKSIRNNKPVGSALKLFLAPLNFIITPATMISKKALLKIGGFHQFKGAPIVDAPTWWRLALEGEFRGVPAFLGFWRRHKRSTSFAYTHQIWKANVQHAQEFVQKYSTQISNLSLSFNLNTLKQRHAKLISSIENNSHFYEGHFHLQTRDFKQAKRNFLLHLKQRQKDFLHSLFSLIGIISCAFENTWLMETLVEFRKMYLRKKL